MILLVPMLVGALFAFRPAWTFWRHFGHLLGSGPKGDADAVAKYFTAAGSNTKVVKFKTRTFSVVHAKAVPVYTTPDAIDNAEAILLGSPFSPSYWDTLNHPVYEPRRGDCAGEPLPVHDVSIGVRGPAVADVQSSSSCTGTVTVLRRTKCRPSILPLRSQRLPASTLTGAHCAHGQ